MALRREGFSTETYGDGQAAWEVFQTTLPDLVILDARDVGSGPIAIVHLPRRMPFGFHANWFAA